MNSRRLRAYPVLALIGAGSALLANLLMHRGWVGGLTGQLMFGDFISYYAGGLIYRTDRLHLYDPAVQEQVQQALVWPSQPPGFAPYISPPYVAAAWSLLAALPPVVALTLWIVLTLAGFAAACYLLDRWVVPPALKAAGLTSLRLGLAVASSYCFLTGLQSGQNHTLTMLLASGVAAAWMRKRWFLAGVLTGALIYKPHLVSGLLILWLARREFRALLGFAAVAVVWAGLSLWVDGFPLLYREYMALSSALLRLPWVKGGFPVAAMATPYALIASLVPPGGIGIVIRIYLFLVGLTAIGLGWAAIRWRHNERMVLVSAFLYPLCMMPHALIYDLLMLVPALLLMACEGWENRVLVLTVGCWLGSFLLPLVGYGLQIALPGILPVSVAALYIRQLRAMKWEAVCPS
ncbi:MAG: glycosyltransferase family 87 protein [Anaerolineae bacterium]